MLGQLWDEDMSLTFWHWSEVAADSGVASRRFLGETMGDGRRNLVKEVAIRRDPIAMRLLALF